MHMLWVELTVSGVLFDIETTVWEVVPSSLGFISKQDMGTISVFKPSPELVLKNPLGFFKLMEPMVLWTLNVISKTVNACGWELTLESWHNVVELKSVGGEVDPSGVGGEDVHRLSWPESVMLVPAGSMWLLHSHVINESINIEFIINRCALILKVLNKDASPFWASDVVSKVFGSTSHISLRKIKLFGSLYVFMDLLVGLVVLMVEWSTVELDYTSASFHVVDGRGKCNLGSETVTSESDHGQLLLVHETNDIVRDRFHGEVIVMIRVSHVSVVQKPDVSDIKDLVALLVEELLEVLNWLNKVTEPNHSGEIMFFTLEELASQFNLGGVFLVRGLYINHKANNEH